MADQLNDSAGQSGTTGSGNGQRQGVGTQVREKAGAARTAAADAYGKATEKVGEAIGTVKEKTAAAYSTSRAKANEAAEAARARASLAARRAADGIEENPMAALVGGLAIGAIAGALLPATRREAKLLGPLGAAAGEAGRIAARTAREAGQQKLAELGIDRDSAREQVSKLVDSALKAAGEAGSAAVKSVRERQGASRTQA